MTDRGVLSAGAVAPVERPVQREESLLPGLLLASGLIRVREARETFNVNGAGTTVAVLGTGLRATHADFAGRVAAQRNFTADNDADPRNASDGHGHGTHVAGIICAGEIHVGMAPAARVVPLKVLTNCGGGSLQSVADALQWVIDHHAALGISALCMPLGDGGNYRSDRQFGNDAVGNRIKQLAALGVVCCLAAGNDYFGHGSAQGMSYPAILRDTLSVGAVYDADIGNICYRNGAEAFRTGADRIAPFSQRLHEKVGSACATDIFAPGAPMTSSGIRNDTAESIEQGTSHATPIVAGVVLLIQALHKRSTGRLPAVADVRRWLLHGATNIQDGDDEEDNVLHTGLPFCRVDAFGALEACARDLAKHALAAASPEGAARARTLAGECAENHPAIVAPSTDLSACP